MKNGTQQLAVLIVEDELRMRELLARAVADMGFECRSVRSGEEAIRAMVQESADIAMLDLNLPAMSGMDVLREIRKRWPETAAIILTGFGDLDAAKEAIHLDVIEFLTKPCPLGDLEKALDRARRRIIESRQPAIPNNLPADLLSAEPGAGPPKLEDIERQHILAALERNNGNRAATAAELGISLRTLYYRLNDYEKQGYRVD